MPSPIGHGLGGIAAGWLAAPRHDLVTALALAAIGAAPDLDLLVNDHRGPAHSLGAALIAGLVVWAGVRSRSSIFFAGSRSDPTGSDPRRWGSAVALAWASHVLLDWLGEDSKAPFGIEALWPLSHEHYRAAHTLFPGVARQFWRPWPFLKTNAYAAGFELLVLLPIVLVILWLKPIRQKKTC